MPADEGQPQRPAEHGAHVWKPADEPRKGPVRRCERKGKGWAWVADTDFIEKTAVPKDLDFPASSKKTGKNLLKPSHKHYKDNNGVYETTDAHGNTVHYAHEGSL